MEKIVWDDSYSVGVHKLDEQHKMLIKMINKLIDMKDITVDSEELSEILTEMTKYANYHFQTEEDLMVKYGFDEYDSHKKQHEAFIKKTVGFCLDTMNYKRTVPVELLSFLKNWLLNHILKSDMKYKPFFSERLPNYSAITTG